jgi:hypothetical protein
MSDQTRAASTRAVGHRTWVIPEGYIPGRSSGPDEMESHETVCLLNTSDRDAAVELTVYFTDRQPAGPYHLTVPAERTLHQWLNELEDPEPIPPDTEYAMVVRSEVPIVVQHTRLDSRQAENALLSTIAFPVAE